MTKHVTRADGQLHPAWCSANARKGRRRPPAIKDHDPHESVHELIKPNHPSGVAVDAYLLEPVELAKLIARQQHDAARKPSQLSHKRSMVNAGGKVVYQAPLLALKFTEPGEQDGYYLLTLAQLRQLSEALTRLLDLSIRSDDTDYADLMSRLRP